MKLSKLPLVLNHLGRLAEAPQLSPVARLAVLGAKAALSPALETLHAAQATVSATHQAAVNLADADLAAALAQAQAAHAAAVQTATAAHDTAQAELLMGDVAGDLPVLPREPFTDSSLPPEVLALLEPVMELLSE